VLAREQFQKPILRVVRVLILIDENELETAPILLENFRVRNKELDGLDQQIVEIEGVLFFQRGLVGRIHVGNNLRERVLRQLLIFFDIDQLVLGSGNRRPHGLGMPALHGDVQPLHGALDFTQRLIGIVDAEVGRPA